MQTRDVVLYYRVIPLIRTWLSFQLKTISFGFALKLNAISYFKLFFVSQEGSKWQGYTLYKNKIVCETLLGYFFHKKFRAKKGFSLSFFVLKTAFYIYKNLG